MKTEFFPGLHQPADCQYIPRCFVSVNRLKTRKSDFKVGRWIMDSGAFTELNIHGYHTLGVDEYAEQIVRWSRCGELVAACAQDYMCEAFMFAGQEDHDEDWKDYMLDEGAHPSWLEDPEFSAPDPIGVHDHQRLTVERYGLLKDAVAARGGQTYIMPVIQGFTPQEYVNCIDLYEKAGHLPHGAYVGVGSVCKRNADPDAVLAVLVAVKCCRPDLQLHGFGLKITALGNATIRSMLRSADSMAWSTAARHERNRIRKQGGDWRAAPSPNDWRTAQAYASRVQELIDQPT